MKKIIEREWYAVCDRLNSLGYIALSDDEKLWVNVRSLIDSINNGGLISYFYNSYADHFDDCMSALDHLDAADVRVKVQIISDLFPRGHLSSIIERNEIINAFPKDSKRDRVLEKIDDELYGLIDGLENKLEAHVVKFLSKGRYNR